MVTRVLVIGKCVCLTIDKLLQDFAGSMMSGWHSPRTKTKKNLYSSKKKQRSEIN